MDTSVDGLNAGIVAEAEFNEKQKACRALLLGIVFPVWGLAQWL
jgi:hypothetical protein